MICKEKNKVYATNLKRIEIDSVWGSIKEGKSIELKLTKKIGQLAGGCKMVELVEEFKVINKSYRTLLVQKLRNGFKETFTFADFITGDIKI